MREISSSTPDYIMLAKLFRGFIVFMVGRPTMEFSDTNVDSCGHDCRCPAVLNSARGSGFNSCVTSGFEEADEFGTSRVGSLVTGHVEEAADAEETARARI